MRRLISCLLKLGKGGLVRSVRLLFLTMEIMKKANGTIAMTQFSTTKMTIPVSWKYYRNFL